MFSWGRKKQEEEQQEGISEAPADAAPPIDQKPFMQAIWPVLACGAGLFSDGYVNNVRRSYSSLSLLARILGLLWRHLGHRLREHYARI